MKRRLSVFLSLFMVLALLLPNGTLYAWGIGNIVHAVTHPVNTVLHTVTHFSPPLPIPLPVPAVVPVPSVHSIAHSVAHVSHFAPPFPFLPPLPVPSPLTAAAALAAPAAALAAPAAALAAPAALPLAAHTLFGHSTHPGHASVAQHGSSEQPSVTHHSLFGHSFFASHGHFGVPPVFTKRIIAAKRALIDRLISQRKFVEAEKSASYLVNTIKHYRLSSADTKKIQADIYRTQLVTSQEKQGKYSNAATTIRKALAIQNDPKDIGKLIELQTNNGRQGQKFNLIKAHNSKLSGLYKSKIPYLSKKIATINKLLRSNDVSAKDMKALQAKLKSYSKKLGVVSNNITKEHKNFSNKMKEYKLDKILLTKKQYKVIDDGLRSEHITIMKAYKLRAEVAKSLTRITEKFKYSWNNLNRDFKELESIQRDALDLKKQIARTLVMKPFKESDKAGLKKLRDKLQKILGEEAKLYKEVEKAFIDQRKFDAISSRDQGSLSGLFAEAWKNNNAIYKNKPTPGYLFTEVKKKLAQKPVPPISIYDKMMVKTMFGYDAVRREGLNKLYEFGYYDKNGKLICTKTGKLWKYANGKPVTTEFTIEKVSQNAPNYRHESAMLNAFPAYKVTRYGLGKDGFVITEVIFGKDGTMIGRHIKTYHPGSLYPKEVWLDRHDDIIDHSRPMPVATCTIDVPVATYTDVPVATYTDVPVATYTENDGDVNNEIAGDERANTDKIDNTSDSGSTSSNSNLMDSF